MANYPEFYIALLYKSDYHTILHVHFIICQVKKVTQLLDWMLLFVVPQKNSYGKWNLNINLL